MSKSNSELMSEEEIIEIVKTEIANTYAERKAKALQGLLDLYYKEKQKTKALGKGQASLMASREKWKERYYKQRRKYKDLADDYNHRCQLAIDRKQEIEYLNTIIESDKDNYIHKDKINKEIDELVNNSNNFNVGDIEVLREKLLEDNNGKQM